MDALILAAGQGSRLKLGRAKCLAYVGGRPLIHHQFDALRAAGVERFFVVAGYQAPLVEQALPGGTTLIYNDSYAKTNSLYSFLLARRTVGRELLVLNCDVLFHPLIAQMVARHPGAALAYDSTSGGDAEEMKVEVRGGRLVTMSKTLAPGRRTRRASASGWRSAPPAGRAAATPTASSSTTARRCTARSASAPTASSASTRSPSATWTCCSARTPRRSGRARRRRRSRSST